MLDLFIRILTISFEDESFDFIFSLGVLHHIPDTKKALVELFKKQKLVVRCLFICITN